MEVASLLLGDVLFDVVDTGIVWRAGSEVTNRRGRTTGAVFILRRHSASEILGTALSEPLELGPGQCERLLEIDALIGYSEPLFVLGFPKIRLVFVRKKSTLWSAGDDRLATVGGG